MNNSISAAVGEISGDGGAWMDAHHTMRMSREGNIECLLPNGDWRFDNDLTADFKRAQPEEYNRFVEKAGGGAELRQRTEAAADYDHRERLAIGKDADHFHRDSMDNIDIRMRSEMDSLKAIDGAEWREDHRHRQVRELSNQWPQIAKVRDQVQQEQAKAVAQAQQEHHALTQSWNYPVKLSDAMDGRAYTKDMATPDIEAMNKKLDAIVAAEKRIVENAGRNGFLKVEKAVQAKWQDMHSRIGQDVRSKAQEGRQVQQANQKHDPAKQQPAQRQNPVAGQRTQKSVAGRIQEVRGNNQKAQSKPVQEKPSQTPARQLFDAAKVKAVGAVKAANGYLRGQPGNASQSQKQGASAKPQRSMQRDPVKAVLPKPMAKEAKKDAPQQKNAGWLQSIKSKTAGLVNRVRSSLTQCSKPGAQIKAQRLAPTPNARAQKNVAVKRQENQRQAQRPQHQPARVQQAQQGHAQSAKIMGAMKAGQQVRQGQATSPRVGVATPARALQPAPGQRMQNNAQARVSAPQRPAAAPARATPSPAQRSIPAPTPSAPSRGR